MWKKKIQSVLVDCQRGIGETLRVKPLTWGHGPNFGSLGIWVVTGRVGNEYGKYDDMGKLGSEGK